ncbi:MAG: hypothetical protein WAS05_00720 [Candidatus Nanopelagicales bacterium]
MARPPAWATRNPSEIKSPPGFRPVWAVAEALDIPIDTIYSWIRRGRVASVCDRTTKLVLVRLEDIRNRIDTRR